MLLLYNHYSFSLTNNYLALTGSQALGKMLAIHNTLISYGECYKEAWGLTSYRGFREDAS